MEISAVQDGLIRCGKIRQIVTPIILKVKEYKDEEYEERSQLSNMNAVELAKQIAVLLQTLSFAITQLVAVIRTLGIRLQRPAQVSYVNFSLRLALDLKDSKGRRAVVTRHQTVHFLVPDVGVMAVPIWGDGNQASRVKLSGARRLGWRPEGPRNVMLLGMHHRPGMDENAKIIARRTVINGFTDSQEYFEAMVERPTERLSLRVVFPKARPPTETYVLATPGQRSDRIPVRLDHDGRPTASWSLHRPKPQTTYSLRWCW